jgi:hypothetical protein
MFYWRHYQQDIVATEILPWAYRGITFVNTTQYRMWYNINKHYSFNNK